LTGRPVDWFCILYFNLKLATCTLLYLFIFSLYLYLFSTGRLADWSTPCIRTLQPSLSFLNLQLETCNLKPSLYLATRNHLYNLHLASCNHFRRRRKESTKPGVLFPALLRSTKRTLRNESRVGFAPLNSLIYTGCAPLKHKRRLVTFSQRRTGVSPVYWKNSPIPFFCLNHSHKTCTRENG